MEPALVRHYGHHPPKEQHPLLPPLSSHPLRYGSLGPVVHFITRETSSHPIQVESLGLLTADALLVLLQSKSEHLDLKSGSIHFAALTAVFRSTDVDAELNVTHTSKEPGGIRYRGRVLPLFAVHLTCLRNTTLKIPYRGAAAC